MAHVYDACPVTKMSYQGCQCSECKRLREAVEAAVAYLKGECEAELTGNRKSDSNQ